MANQTPKQAPPVNRFRVFPMWNPGSGASIKDGSYRPYYFMLGMTFNPNDPQYFAGAAGHGGGVCNFANQSQIQTNGCGRWP